MIWAAQLLRITQYRGRFAYTKDSNFKREVEAKRTISRFSFYFYVVQEVFIGYLLIAANF